MHYDLKQNSSDVYDTQTATIGDVQKRVINVMRTSNSGIVTPSHDHLSQIIEHHQQSTNNDTTHDSNNNTSINAAASTSPATSSEQPL